MNMLTRLNRGDGLFPVTLRGVDDIFRTVLGQFAPDFTPEMMWDSGLAPKLEVEVKEDAVTARLPIPGCKPEDIDIEVVGTSLTIRARRESEVSDDDKAHYLRQERSFSEYEERVKLPVAIKGGETKAEYKDGILTVTLPRETAVPPTAHVVKVN